MMTGDGEGGGIGDDGGGGSGFLLDLRPLNPDCIRTAAFWTSGSPRSMSISSSSFPLG